MTVRLFAAALLAAATLGGCTAPPPGTSAASPAPAAVALGAGVDCISTSSIDNTVVHDDRTIDFRMRDGTVYRNTLPVSCNPLGWEKRFSYRTQTSRLCSSDTITVMQSGGVGAPTCSLGQFVPVRVTGS